jgi:ribose transport system substrate-binding protein
MLKVIFSMLIGILLIISVMFGKLVISTDLKTEDKISIENPRYHLQLIIQDTDEYFWTLFQEGATAAAEEIGVYAEFVKVSQRNADELRIAVEMGVNAGVDGIALQAADKEQTSLMIEDAKERGISVITYENDNFLIPNTPMVGTNSYSLGSIAGDMTVKASGGRAKVAVIINNAGEQGDVQYNNMIIQGLLDSFAAYSTIDLDSSNIYTISSNMYEAEKIATAIVEKSNPVDLIVCFNEGSTPVVAQVLVDNNKVGDIQFIGYGNMPLTLDYIERGVIYASVCPDAYEIGYNTVKQLGESLNGEQISDSISTELYTIDKSNVNEMEHNLEGASK